MSGKLERPYTRLKAQEARKAAELGSGTQVKGRVVSIGL